MNIKKQLTILAILRKAKEEIEEQTGCSVVLNPQVTGVTPEERRELASMIAATASVECGYSLEIVKGNSREEEMTNVRAVIAYLCYMLINGVTYREIGEAIGRDGATAHYCVKLVNRLLPTNDENLLKTFSIALPAVQKLSPL
jgi:hypothetical protein